MAVAPMPVEWVFFDMDGTLCDVVQAVASALDSVNSLLGTYLGREVALPSPEDYEKAWRSAAEGGLRAGLTHEHIRRGSIRHALSHRGIRLPPAQEQAVFDEYFRVRFERTAPFPEVHPAASMPSSTHSASGSGSPIYASSITSSPRLIWTRLRA